MEKLRIAVLISGTGSNMKAIVNACKEGKIDGEVVCVGSDNPKAEGLVWAKEKSLPTFVVDYGFSSPLARAITVIQNKGVPEDFDIGDILEKEHIRPALEPIGKKIFHLKSCAIKEAQLLAQLQKYPFDLLVLAGFMKVLSPYAIDRINVGGKHRIMNIHPSLLPAFPGTDGYGDTFRYGCKIGGCTVHFVDYGEDTGPIIGQEAYEIFPDDTEDSIKEKGLKNEHELYPRCIQLFAENRLKVVDLGGRKVVEILPAEKK